MLWITDLTQNEIGPDMRWEKLINEFDAGMVLILLYRSPYLARIITEYDM